MMHEPTFNERQNSFVTAVFKPFRFWCCKEAGADFMHHESGAVLTFAKLLFWANQTPCLLKKRLEWLIFRARRSEHIRCRCGAKMVRRFPYDTDPNEKTPPPG